MGNIKWMVVLAFLLTAAGIVFAIIDAHDDAMVAGLLAVAVAVLSLHEK